jgi:hypothetical protein
MHLWNNGLLRDRMVQYPIKLLYSYLPFDNLKSHFEGMFGIFKVHHILSNKFIQKLMLLLFSKISCYKTILALK